MTAKKEGGNIRENFINGQLAKEKKLSIWLWIGVVGLGLIIIIFSGYSLWSNITSINWKKTEESKLFKQSSTDFNEIFEKNNQNELRNQLDVKQIKELLNKSLKQQSSTLISSTSQSNNSIFITPTTTTSTTITTTTKK